jgi:putative FmdB family regulatory protein
MPIIDYTCRQCDHRFQRVVLQGDRPLPAPCPKCKNTSVPPDKPTTGLFKGIANFSDLAKDTN